MATIQKLSAELIGQIAAGEVVERPASAVKELVENSIDAGATSITVELREGGIEYLRISDNGRGIPAEQIRMAFERHATSKLSKAEDLYNIHTLGFRGEALASIAAVAKVTCTTRTEAAEFGARVTIEAGAFTDIRQAASPVGTTLVVEKLFQNTPVRLKFLKKPAMEAAMVSDYMLRLILSKPDISFRFVSQGKTIYHSMGDGRVESALFCLYGKDALKQMRKVHGHANGVMINGYVGVGELARGNRQQQSFFINGRYFKSALLSKALEMGCEGRVTVGRFPMCALSLELPYQQVDVNVHPNKLEVRFQNEAAVAEAVETLAREAMQTETLGARLSADSAPKVVAQPQAAQFTVRQIAGEVAGEEAQADTKESAPPLIPQTAKLTNEKQENPQKQDKVPPMEAANAEKLKEKPLPPSVPSMPEPITILHPTASKPVLREGASPWTTLEMLKRVQATQPLPPAAPIAAQVTEKQAEQTALAIEGDLQPLALRLVGVAFRTYWIFESADKLLMVDQHAAHERILYDRLMKRFEKEHVSQRLLLPQLVRLTAHDRALALELKSLLSEVGFEIEAFDDDCVSVHAIPSIFGRNEAPRELLLEALDEWQNSRGQATRERMRKQVAQMACKHAIKGGDALSEVEMEGFLREMLRSDVMPTCPHGRPIVTEITRYALEKRFKRVQ